MTIAEASRQLGVNSGVIGNLLRTKKLINQAADGQPVDILPESVECYIAQKKKKKEKQEVAPKGQKPTTVFHPQSKDAIK